ncbi:3-hydroxyacyl-CoA dehydrogenase [Bradyrhizobium sp. LB7.2]
MAAVIKKVGVIGAGQMGSGIAHVAALAGFDVVLNDISADRLKSGMATINGNLARQVSPRRPSARTTKPRRWRASWPARSWTISRTAIS